MNGFMNFLGDPRVHDTALLTMVISSLLAAIRRFKTIDNTPIAPGWWAKTKLIWNFFYDWMTGFWSMKQGQPVHPLEIQTSTSEPGPNGPKTQQSTLTTEESIPPPLAPPAAPAQPKQ